MAFKGLHLGLPEYLFLFSHVNQSLEYQYRYGSTFEMLPLFREVTPTLVEQFLRYLTISAWPRDNLLLAAGCVGLAVGILIGAAGVVVALRLSETQSLHQQRESTSPVSVNVHQSVNAAETSGSRYSSSASLDLEPASHGTARLRRGGGTMA
jgi:hypothetical protein